MNGLLLLLIFVSIFHRFGAVAEPDGHIKEIRFAHASKTLESRPDFSLIAVDSEGTLRRQNLSAKLDPK